MNLVYASSPPIALTVLRLGNKLIRFHKRREALIMSVTYIDSPRGLDYWIRKPRPRFGVRFTHMGHPLGLTAKCN